MGRIQSRTVIAMVLLANVLDAQAQACTWCVNGVCYQPAPVATPAVPSNANVNGTLVSITVGQRMSLSDGMPGSYPPLPMWTAQTCPIANPIFLFGSIGLPLPLPPFPFPNPMPGANTPAPSTPVPPAPPSGGTAWPPHNF